MKYNPILILIIWKSKYKTLSRFFAIASVRGSNLQHVGDCFLVPRRNDSKKLCDHFFAPEMRGGHRETKKTSLF